jgi:hypothetical protein
LPTRSLSGLLDISLGSGKGKGRVPWSRLQRAQGDYIKPKYLPKHVAIRQYYHLRQGEVNAILEHWAKRQDSGKIPFRFRKASKETQQNEANLEANDSDAAVRPGEESEGDLQDNNNRQVGDDSHDDGSTEQAHSPGNVAENLVGVR